LSTADKEEGTLQCGRTNYFAAKNLRFFENYGVPTRTRKKGDKGSVRFEGKVVGSIFFSILFGSLFMGVRSPLTITFKQAYFRG